MAYGIILDYVGSDDKGQVLKPNKELRSRLRKIIPVQLTKVTFNSTSGGTMYAIEARPIVDSTLTLFNQTLTEDVTLVGKTVHEMLQSGAQSLQYYLNRYKGSEGKASKRDKDN